MAGDAAPVRARRPVLRADARPALPRPHLLSRARPATILTARRFFNPGARDPPGGSIRAASSTAGPRGERAAWPEQRAGPPDRAAAPRRGRRDAGHLDRPCHRAGPDRRASTSSPIRSGRTAPRLSPSSARAGCARRACASRICRRIDLVLVSHNHYDHMDLPTLRRLWERDRPLIVTSLGNDTILRGAGIEAVARDWGGRVPRCAAPGLPGDLSVVIVERNHHWGSRWGTRPQPRALVGLHRRGCPAATSSSPATPAGATAPGSREAAAARPVPARDHPDRRLSAARRDAAQPCRTRTRRCASSRR